MSSPKVSVLLCCYNHEAFVKDAIESVLAQTHSNTEAIVVDNGSTDGSREIIRRYEAHPRVKVLLKEKNGPVTRRLNQAFSLSSGDYLSILYTDDFYLPEKIERQLAVFQTLPEEYGVVYSPGYRLNVLTQERWLTSGMTCSGNVLQAMFEHYHRDGFINPISPLFRRHLLERHPFFEDVFQEGEGHYFRLAITAQFQYLDEPLVVMRDHEANMGKAIRQNLACLEKNLQKIKADPDFPPKVKPYADLFLARVYRNYGYQGIRVAQEPQWARRCFFKALRLSPKQAFHPRLWLGLPLTYLPTQGLAQLNQALRRILKKKGVLAFKKGYT